MNTEDIEFNGVLFILREPNSNGEVVTEGDREWFYKVINGDRTANRYGHYAKSFSAYMEHTDLDNKSLAGCRLENIHPEYGNPHCSKTYKDMGDTDKLERFNEIITEYCPRYVFTCDDIFKAVYESENLSYNDLPDGLFYPNKKTKKQKKMMIYTHKGKIINVFEICHPGNGWTIRKDAE